MIIGFSGKMGSGKTEALKALKFHLQNTAFKIEVIKLAQPLYDIQEYAYRRIQLAHTRPANFEKDRKLLQWLGTDWGRDTIKQSLWTDIWKEQVMKSQASIVFCDDVRFNDDAQAVLDVGGIVVKINASHTANRVYTAAGIPNHKSEAEIDSGLATFIIDNNGTKREYLDKLTELYNKIF